MLLLACVHGVNSGIAFMNLLLFIVLPWRLQFPLLWNYQIFYNKIFIKMKRNYHTNKENQNPLSYSLFWTGDTWKQFSRAPSSCQKFADQSNWGISNTVQWNAISSDWHVVCAVCQIPRGGKEIDSFEKKKELISKFYLFTRTFIMSESLKMRRGM